MIDLTKIYREGELFDGRYQLKKRIGGGGFSEVWLAFDSTARIDVALKVYVSDTRGLDEDGISMFREEFAIVSDINHTNLLRPFTYNIINDHPYLVLPYCEAGPSSKLRGKIDEDTAWQFIKDVSSGLNCLHNHKDKEGNRIIHQDIKPQNILINSSGQFVITDFGISTKLRRTIRTTSHLIEDSVTGTRAYMGPERFPDKNNPDKDLRPILASDIWSLGASIYELITGDAPYGDFGGSMQSGAVPKIKKNISENLKEVIYACLDIKPEKRPTPQRLIYSCEEKKLVDKSYSKQSGKSIYKWFALIILLLSLPAVAYIIRQHDPPVDVYLVRQTHLCDSLLLFSDSIIQIQFGKSNLNDVQEKELALAMENIIEAKKMNIELRTAHCDSSFMMAYSIIEKAYKFFEGEEEKSNRWEAPERAKLYRDRKIVLQKYINN